MGNPVREHHDGVDAAGGGGKVKEVLERAGEDLDNAQLPSLVNWAFAPFRDLILSPIVHTASKVAPAIPIVDDVISFFLGNTFQVVKSAYSILPQTQEEGFRHQVQHEAEKEAVVSMKKRGRQEKPSGIVSTVKAGFGFVFNAAVDFLTSPGQKVSEWGTASIALLGYLLYSGIGRDLAQAFARPGAINDIRIMGNVQARLKDVRHAQVATEEVRNFPLKDAMWYMRYATAAYGMSMMESAERLITFDPLANWTIFRGPKRMVAKTMAWVFGSWDDVNKAKIQRYVNIKPYDLVYITPLYVGGSTELLRHFVAVDSKKKAVVLAIRGTFTVSGLVTDLDGTTVEFCGGYAHKGIQEMAAAILHNQDTISAIKNALRRYEGYELILTGHSLGAGVACLANIQCHYENRFPSTQIRCFGFASPPVFAAKDGTMNFTNIRVRMAIDNATCYIHEDDCVPFLGADSVRRLAFVINKLHEEDHKVSVLDRWRMASGKMTPTESIVNVVVHGADGMPSLGVGGAIRLYIPAKTVLWMYKTTSSDGVGSAVIVDPEGFSAQYSDPTRLAALNILLSPDMISDHMPAMYERALYAVFRTNLLSKKKAPETGNE